VANLHQKNDNKTMEQTKFFIHFIISGE